MKWTHGEESLQKFLEELNDFNQNIKFTYEYSAKSIPFLDLKVGLKDRKITTELHVKPTDRHQYLHFSSTHPNHTKRSLVFSQTLRMSRLCSNCTYLGTDGIIIKIMLESLIEGNTACKGICMNTLH